LRISEHRRKGRIDGLHVDSALGRLALWLLLLAFVPSTLARAQSVTATIDRPEVSVQDPLHLTVTIEGSRSARPQLPDLSDFDVRSRGQSTQMSFVNGQLSSSVKYDFVLSPKRPGTFSIGPVTVEIDHEIYSSKPFTVRIVGASQATRDSQDLFITAKVSTTNPFVGQEVIYVWRFYRRIRIGDARLEPQDFSGFLAEDLGEVREYRSTVNGVQYLVSEIRKSLFPQEVGPVVIPASRLTCEVLTRSRRRGGTIFDEFFGTSATDTKVLRSRQIELEVRTLPVPPRGFSGLVGEFEINGEVSQAELRVGESTTLRTTVRGSGNVQMIGEPKLPELPAFKTYDDKPTGAIKRDGARLTGFKTYSRALVPLEVGEPVIPPVKLIYFDPNGESYRTAATAAIPLRVGPRQGVEALHLTEAITPTTGKVAVRILADDLLPIYKGLDAVRHRRVRSWTVAFGLMVPALVFIGTFLVQRRRNRFALDHDLRRRHRATKRFRAGLKQVVSSPVDDSQRAQLASRVLREYIGDKLGVEGTALTPEEVDQRLREKGVTDDLVKETHELLVRLEASQYGATVIEADLLSEQLGSLVGRLEKQVRA
jgi:hypothetical protein